MATHYYDEGVLRAGTVDPRVSRICSRGSASARRRGSRRRSSRRRSIHPGVQVCGQIDRAGYFAKFADHLPTDLITVDIKLGDPEDAGARWQTARTRCGLSDPAAVLGPVCADDRRPIDLENATTTRSTDWQEFCQFVTTYRRQAVRRKAADDGTRPVRRRPAAPPTRSSCALVPTCGEDRSSSPGRCWRHHQADAGPGIRNYGTGVRRSPAEALAGVAASNGRVLPAPTVETMIDSLTQDRNRVVNHPPARVARHR
jgi:hypothetical protein